MYAEAGLLFPFLHGFPPELHHAYHPLQEELLCRLQISNGLLDGAGAVCTGGQLLRDAKRLDIASWPVGRSMEDDCYFCMKSNMLLTTTVTDYDLGGEGDLFKAPEPIIEEPVMELDPVAAAISMMSSGDDIIAAEAIKGADIDSIQNEQPLSEVFYECKKDLLEKSVIEDTFSELSDVEIPALQIEEDNISALQFEEQKTVQNNKVVEDGLLQKSVSSGCLMSLSWNNGGSMRPNFLDFQGMDLGAVLGMRRVYSEGDIQTLGNGSMSHVSTSIIRAPFERLSTIGDYKSEERRQKLSRYRKKKTERNFGRKIKYACRKALADSQPRVRGRFAKTEDCEIAKPSKYK